jgi:hypothetical protein
MRCRRLPPRQRQSSPDAFRGRGRVRRKPQDGYPLGARREAPLDPKRREGIGATRRVRSVVCSKKAQKYASNPTSSPTGWWQRRPTQIRAIRRNGWFASPTGQTVVQARQREDDSGGSRSSGDPSHHDRCAGQSRRSPGPDGFSAPTGARALDRSLTRNGTLLHGSNVVA